MTFGIKYKLFLTLFITSTIVVVSMFFFMQWSFNRGFINYVSNQELTSLDHLASSLVEYFQREGSWDAMTGNPRLWQSIQREASPNKGQQPAAGNLPDYPPDRAAGPLPGQLSGYPSGPPSAGSLGQPRRPLPGRPGEGMDPLRIGPRTALVDADRQTLLFGAQVKDLKQLNLRPLELEGRIIGYLGLVKPAELTDDADMNYVEQQSRVFALIAVTMVIVSMLLGIPLINHLLVPIKAMTKGAGRLTSGDYATRIPVATRDELGQLSHDFNVLAETLERNEEARRQWMADISHELRTPLAILRGEIEALQDGVRRPDEQTLAALHGEILRLNRLVGDLYELSMSDIGALSYRKHRIDPVVALEQTVELFTPRMAKQKIALVADLPEEGRLAINADPHRLQQLFTNLLENSLRYTDPDGRVEVLLEKSGKSLKLSVQDSAPGVTDQQRPKLFDRLYRVESSRNRAKGGTGLGLAVCKNIVEAHGGTIEALPSPLGGLRIEITLPT